MIWLGKLEWKISSKNQIEFDMLNKKFINKFRVNCCDVFNLNRNWRFFSECAEIVAFKLNQNESYSEVLVFDNTIFKII